MNHRADSSWGPETGELTSLLRRFSGGEAAVEERLAAIVYPVLRRLAARRLSSEPAENQLSPTELTHEAYLSLFRGRAPVDWRDRRHFLALAARVIRNLVVDLARERLAAKRGGGDPTLSLSLAERGEDPRDAALVALDDALRRLAEIDPEAAQVLELRYFVGLSTPEIAEACSLSIATVGRRGRFARAWLERRLRSRLDR
jgi:RNA polymerase sigma factor (TIGR02999 family)